MAEPGPASKSVWLQSYSSFLCFAASPQETGHTLKPLIRDCNNLMVTTGSRHPCGSTMESMPIRGRCWGSWEAPCSRQGWQWHQQAWPAGRDIEKARSQQAGKTKAEPDTEGFTMNLVGPGTFKCGYCSQRQFVLFCCEHWHSFYLYKRICK